MWEYDKLGKMAQSVLPAAFQVLSFRTNIIADTGAQFDAEAESVRETINAKMKHFGRDKSFGTVQKVQELLASERFRHT